MPIQGFDASDLDLGSRQATVEPNPADYLLFALGAVRRRKLLTAGILLACLSILIAYYELRPPLYRAEARILVQRQQAREDQPTRDAWELIHRRDNLVELIKMAGLLEPEAKPEPTGWLQRAVTAVTNAPAAEDAQEDLILLLNRRLKVEASEVTIGIELDWPDPQQAYRIVDGAVQNFLEARHVEEVTALDESIASLRGRTAVLSADLDQVVEETRRAVRQEAARSSRAQPAAPTSSQQHQATEELVRLRSMLEAKERAIGDVEEFRRRRLAELQAQYESRRSVYAEAHPEMVSLRHDIAALTRESPQTAALRAEERQLREEYQARLARQPSSRPDAPATTELVLRPSTDGIEAAVDRNERVRDARSRFQEVMASVNRAQIELDTARSRFKYRYKVSWPVHVPKKPVSPNPLKIFGIGGFASLVLALLAPVALDWRSGKVLERWQIERGLNLPILGEIRRAR